MRAFLLCLAMTAAAAGQAPATAPSRTSAAPPAAPSAVPSDEAVASAIRRGLDWLYSRQGADGAWPSRHGRQHPGGPESLVVLAALAAGEDANRPELRKALDTIRRMDPQTVYARSVRTMAYARLIAQAGGPAGPPAADTGRRLSEDAAWLVKAQDRSGGWGYGSGHPTTAQNPEWADSSNSLMATMALDEAADAGAAVPQPAWVKVRSFWVASQNDDGGWGYESARGKPLRLRGASYGSMTVGALAAGLAAIEHDALTMDSTPGMLFAPTRPAEGAETRMIDRGLKWLSGNYASDRVPRWVWGAGEDWLPFYHWHTARAAAMAGLRTVAGQDWWAQAAACELELQGQDGSWSAAQDSGKDDSKDPVVRTALAVLALAEGGRPAAINKLALGGRWEGSHRDAANVTRWLSGPGGVSASWQLLEANSSRRVLAEAPILYVEVPPALAIAQEQADEIRAYVRGGGTLVVQSVPQDRKFAEQLVAYLLAVFKGCRSEPLKGEHPVFRARFSVPPVEGFEIRDALRTRAFLFVGDISGPAHRGGKDAAAAFQTWANILDCATDGQPLRGKLSFRRPAAAPQTVRNVAVARLKHGGDWNICPGAMKRLGDVLASAVSVAVEEQPVEAAAAGACKAPLLWIAGTGTFDLSQEELVQLKKYVEGGGTAFIDSTASAEETLQSARKLARETAGEEPQELPADHPLITGRFAGGAGSDISTVAFSKAAAKKAGAPNGKPGLLGVSINGRLAVIISPLSVTCPLEGLPTYGLVGLSVADARRLAANLVLYTSFKTGQD